MIHAGEEFEEPSKERQPAPAGGDEGKASQRSWCHNRI